MSDAEHAFAIHQLLFRYASTFDAGDWDGFASLFDHGTLHLQGVWKPATGREAVREMLDRRVIVYDGSPRTNHLMHNISIEFDGGEPFRARCSTYVQVLQQVDDLPIQTVATGIYKDVVELVEGRWRFVERVAHGSLVGDLSRHLRRLPELKQKSDSQS